MQQRLDQFDVLKGIGILLVLLGHLPTGENAHMLIYTFHMPLFFFCSGFFYKKQPLAKQLKKDVKSLIIPYLFFASVLIMTMACIQIFHYHTLSAITNININPFDSQCYALYHTIWFLLCLFFVREIFNIVYFSKYIITGILILVLYFIAQTLQYRNITIPFFIDSALGMTIFYFMGYVFRQTNLYKMNLKWYYCLIILSLFIVAMEYINPFVNTRDNVYPWYLFAISLIPIFSLYYLSEDISKYNSKVVSILKICGIGSLFIFSLHGPIFEVAFIVLAKFRCSDTMQTIILFIITIPICLAVRKMVNKYAPSLIGKQ